MSSTPPIVILTEVDRPAIQAHLLRLSSDDRRLRFFCTISDDGVRHYASTILDFKTTTVFGAFRGKDLIGMACLAKATSTSAEAAFSIDANERGTGLARELMRAVIRRGRELKLQKLCMSCLRYNTKMQALAVSFGLDLKLDFYEAYAELGFPAGYKLQTASVPAMTEGV